MRTLNSSALLNQLFLLSVEEQLIFLGPPSAVGADETLPRLFSLLQSCVKCSDERSRERKWSICCTNALIMYNIDISKHGSLSPNVTFYTFKPRGAARQEEPFMSSAPPKPQWGFRSSSDMLAVTKRQNSWGWFSLNGAEMSTSH